jgi:hypothetical protein
LVASAATAVNGHFVILVLDIRLFIPTEERVFLEPDDEEETIRREVITIAYEKPKLIAVAPAGTVVQNQMKCACVYIDCLLDANK